MRKLRRKLLLILVLVVLVGVVFLIAQPREPFFKGRRLSWWLQGYVRHDDSSPGGAMPTAVEADEAMANIGTNAIPTLLRMISAKEAGLKLRLRKLAEMQKFIDIPPNLDGQKHNEAASGFMKLGPAARDAVPALVEIYERDIDESSRIAALHALGAIGPDARTAVPVLLRDARGTNQDYRMFCITALGQIRVEPELIVPALVKFLGDTNESIQLNAVLTLGCFGTNARSASPALVKLRNLPKADQDGLGALMTDEIDRILKKIDPEAAAKAGIK